MAEFAPRNFTVTLPVYPPIPMIQSSALALATRLASKLSLTDIHMSDEVWEYKRPHATEGQPRGMVTVQVREGEIKIEHAFPATGLEQFERLVRQVLSSFHKPFAPSVVFGVNIELDYVVELSGDARQSLLEGLRLFGGYEDVDKIDAFGRPCHLIGLRLGFPAYREVADEQADDDSGEDGEDDGAADPPATKEAESKDSGDSEEKPANQAESSSDENGLGGSDWHATVTMVTLEDDPSKISVEVAGLWPKPYPWKNVEDMVEERIEVASAFLRDRISGFLEHFRGKTDGE